MLSVWRERSRTTNQTHQAMTEKGGGRQRGGEKKGEGGEGGGEGGGGRPQLSDEISSAQGLVLGLSIHPSNS